MPRTREGREYGEPESKAASGKMALDSSSISEFKRRPAWAGSVTNDAKLDCCPQGLDGSRSRLKSAFCADLVD